jgi:hypothetical protein
MPVVGTPDASSDTRKLAIEPLDIISVERAASPVKVVEASEMLELVKPKLAELSDAEILVLNALEADTL